MRTIYIVFHNDHMIFAFHHQHEAEDYIRKCIEFESEPKTYTRSNLYWRSVTIWDTYPN